MIVIDCYHPPMKTTVILASGPSLTQADCGAVHAWRDECRDSRSVIVVNTTFRAAMWADWLYTNDDDWLDVHIAEITHAFLDQTGANFKWKNRAVFAHDEEVEMVHLTRRRFDKITMSVGKGVAVHHHGSIAARPQQGLTGLQPVRQALTVLQQHHLPLAGQQPEIQGSKGRGVIGLGVNEKRFVSGSTSPAHQAVDDLAEQWPALPGGIDGEHLQHISGTGAGRDENLVLVDTEHLVKAVLEGETALFDQRTGFTKAG